MRPVLLVGGAPRIRIDAVRFMSVSASGRTALRVRTLLAAHGASAVEMLLSRDALPELHALRYESRPELDAQLRAWITGHPTGVVMMSAAVNDYELLATQAITADGSTSYAASDKIPSGADELVVRLRPAPKLIDQLRGWGLRGPLIAFKYQARETVVAAAQALLRRVGAVVVFANSLDGGFQALVDAEGVTMAETREEGLSMLSRRIIEM